MTASEQAYRWPAEPPEGPEWKQVAGFSSYEWSHRGLVRSVDRTRGGRNYRGMILAQRVNNSGYRIVNVTDDQGVKQTVLVHRMVLLAHDGKFEDGQETLHGPGGPEDDRYPENLRRDSRPANVAEMVAARPPRPVKPQPRCINYAQCGNLAGKGGKRCLPCVVEVGCNGARLLASGTDLERAAEQLNYPSPIGLWRHAINHGGLRLSTGVSPLVITDEVNAAMAAHPEQCYSQSRPSLASQLRSVRANLRAWLASGDAE